MNVRTVVVGVVAAMMSIGVSAPTAGAAVDYAAGPVSSREAPPPPDPPAGAAPTPDWRIATASSTTRKSTAHPDTVWGCKGHADNPGLATDAQHRPYIAFSATQICTGQYTTQRVCIKLQEKDYFGNFNDRTAFTCSVWTVMSSVFKGASVLCSAAGHGTYRTAAYGQAEPNGVVVTSSTHDSYSATLC